MKRFNQGTGAGAIALLAFGVLACGDTDRIDFGDGIVLTGNGGTGGAIGGSGGADTGGSGGTGMMNGGTGGVIHANGGSDAGGASGEGGTDTGGSGGTGNTVDPNNLITNPGFEVDTEGWSAAFGGDLSVSTAQAHSGAQSAVVSNRVGDYQGLHIDATELVQQGATYSVSAFARISAASDTLKLTARIDCEGKDYQYAQIDITTEGSNSAWTELSGSLAMPSEFECFLENVLIYVEGPAAGVDLYVDDVYMAELDPPVEVANLFSNSDFEIDATGWTAAFGGTLSASTAQAHGGAQSVLVTGRTATHEGPHYDLTSVVEMGATYSFSAFGRLADGASDTLKLTARLQCEGKADQYFTIDSVTASGSAWTLLEGTLVLPDEPECFMNELRVYAEGPVSGVDIYLDDVWGVQAADPVPVDNLITNSDFEIDTAGWSAASGGTLAVSAAQAQDGAQSAIVTGRTATYQGPHFDLTGVVEQGATYAFSAFARVSGAVSDAVKLSAYVQCEGDADRYLTIDTGTATDSKWTLLEGEVRLPAVHDCVMTTMRLYAEGPAAGVDLYIDNVWGRQTAEAPVVENLITNSDFEAGISPWTSAFGGTISVSTAQAHGGSQSAVLTGRTSDSQGLHYDLTSTVEMGATYVFSTFARISAASDPVKLTARLQCDGLTDQFLTLDSATANDTAWTFLRGELVMPAAVDCFLNDARIYVEGPAAGVDVYIDDVWGVKTVAAPGVENLIGNSDFEAGIDGWTAAFGGAISASTAQAHSGLQSAVVTGRDATSQGAFRNMTSLVQLGSTYSFSAFTLLGGAASDTVNLTARIKCSLLADNYVQIDTLTASDSAWSFLNGDLALPGADTCGTLNELLLYVEGPQPTVDLYVDDVWGVLVP